jgi:MFS transporter, MHS family, proline/betaine transporter
MATSRSRSKSSRRPGLIRRTPNTRAVVAAVIGNAFEWYDFVVFSFMIVAISTLFFPTASDYSSILLTTATFGVAFVMRPIGGIVLGLYADRAGRKAALSLAIALMTLGIFLLAVAAPCIRAPRRCRRSASPVLICQFPDVLISCRISNESC